MAKTLIAFFSRADENYFGGAMRYVEVGNTEIAVGKIKELIDADAFDFNIVRETFRLVFWLYIVTSFAIKYFRSREIPEEEALNDNEAPEEEAPEEEGAQAPGEEKTPADDIEKEEEAEAKPESEEEAEEIAEEEPGEEIASEPEPEIEPEIEAEPEDEPEAEPEEEPEDDSDGELKDYEDEDAPVKNDPGELHFNPEA